MNQALAQKNSRYFQTQTCIVESMIKTINKDLTKTELFDNLQKILLRQFLITIFK